MGSFIPEQQAIHLVFGTDEGMVREKASGVFAALTERMSFPMKSWKRAAEIPMKRPKLSARSWRPCAHCLFSQAARWSG